jgi:CRP-like cAMP-binding protein
MINMIEDHPLFENIKSKDIDKLLACLSVYQKGYKKNEYIIQIGNKIDFVGIILSGRVFMESEDFYGNNRIYTEIQQKSLFGEVFICPQTKSSNVNYKAITDCTILFIKYENILHMCKMGCSCHQLLIENLVNLIALKSRYLINKIEIISNKTIRERILTYLTQLSFDQHSITVTSPLNHKEMACFLCVNRSSMVRELHNMKVEKLINYDRNIYNLSKAVLNHSMLLDTKTQ